MGLSYIIQTYTYVEPRLAYFFQGKAGHCFIPYAYIANSQLCSGAYAVKQVSVTDLGKEQWDEDDFDDLYDNGADDDDDDDDFEIVDEEDEEEYSTDEEEDDGDDANNSDESDTDQQSNRRRKRTVSYITLNYPQPATKTVNCICFYILSNKL